MPFSKLFLMKLKYPSLKDEDFTEILLSVLSSIKPVKMRLTASEITCLKEFINLAPKYRSQMFSTLSKSKVISSLKSKGMSLSSTGLNIKLYSMVKKGFLKRDEDSVIILNPSILALISQFREKGTLDFVLNFTREEKENR